MKKIEKLSITGYEEVVVCENEPDGLKAIIAMHDTALGPAVGGTRMYPYPSREQALADVLKLAKAMTYKAAAADMPFGGGKAVIIADPQQNKTKRLLMSFGRFLEYLGGRFVTGEDVGTTADDMEIIARETKYAIFPSKSLDVEWKTSFLTAYGVFHGIRASVQEAFANDSLAGIRVAIQGAGKVAEELIPMLQAADARIIVSDVDQQRLFSVADKFGAEAVAAHSIYKSKAEVFSPCALGGILDRNVIAQLQCRIVAGAANNQLNNAKQGWQLWKRGILYAPDYVINAGGLISALYEMGACTRKEVMGMTQKIYARLRKIYKHAETADIPPNQVADDWVAKRLGRARAKLSGARDHRSKAGNTSVNAGI